MGKTLLQPTQQTTPQPSTPIKPLAVESPSPAAESPAAKFPTVRYASMNMFEEALVGPLGKLRQKSPKII
jgi:hypothetical protein